MVMSAIGTCHKCGQGLISVNGNASCIFCVKPESSSGLTVTIEDPGEEALRAVSSKAGVNIDKGERPPTPEKPVIGIAPVVKQPLVEVKPMVRVQGHGIKDALSILKSLPMPSDIKKYKSINKAIKILEDLGEKENG